MSNENRNDSIIVEAIAASPGIAWFDVKSGALGQAFDSLVPAVLSAFLAFVAFLAGGQWLVPSPETARIAIAGFAAWLSFNGLYLIDRRLSAPRYRAQYGGEVGEDEEPAGDDFIRVDHDSPNQTRRVSEAMLARLKVLGENYERLGETLAVQAWYRNGGPMSRTQIEAVRAFLLEYGYADEKAGGQMELNGKGERALGEWRMGNFGRLSPSPVGGNHGA